MTMRPCSALHHGEVGQIEAAHLVEAGGDLEQAGLVVQPGLAPQAGVDLGRRLLLEEAVGVEVPDIPAPGVRHPGRAGRCDASAGGALVIAAVGQEGEAGGGSVGRGGGGGGGLGCEVVLVAHGPGVCPMALPIARHRADGGGDRPHPEPTGPLHLARRLRPGVDAPRPGALACRRRGVAAHAPRRAVRGGLGARRRRRAGRHRPGPGERGPGLRRPGGAAPRPAPALQRPGGAPTTPASSLVERALALDLRPPAWAQHPLRPGLRLGLRDHRLRGRPLGGPPPEPAARRRPHRHHLVPLAPGRGGGAQGGGLRRVPGVGRRPPPPGLGHHRGRRGAGHGVVRRHPRHAQGRRTPVLARGPRASGRLVAVVRVRRPPGGGAGHAAGPPPEGPGRPAGPRWLAGAARPRDRDRAGVGPARREQAQPTMAATPVAKRSMSSSVVAKLVIQRTSDSLRSHSQKNDHSWRAAMRSPAPGRTRR